MKRSKINLPIILLLTVLAVYFGLFLVYPIGFSVVKAFGGITDPTLEYFRMLAVSPLQRKSIINSLLIAGLSTAGTIILSMPIASLMVRAQFRGKNLLGALLLTPMITPPFIGAIGLKQILSRFGSLNLTLMELGILPADKPIDWLGYGGFWGIVILQVLHLYPIMYLNISAALGNLDPTLSEAAHNLGAGKWRVFRTITLPLIIPGLFAGGAIVFIWSFTDLGTPLILGFSKIASIQVFNSISDLNTDFMGYTLVVVILAISLALFFVSKKLFGIQKFESRTQRRREDIEHPLGATGTFLVWAVTGLLIFTALIPQIGALLHSFSGRWFFTPLPSEWTLSNYSDVFRQSLTLTSIKNSLFYAGLSAVIDLWIGVAIAWLLTRRKPRFAFLLDAMAMLPLALPGIVLAFGYVAGFDWPVSWLNPRQNPAILLIIGYSIRRLPYMVRSAYAGFQQANPRLEEASLNLGASQFRTFIRITMPIIRANLIAGTILTFSFAMLEVSESLILAMREQYYPMTKMIYQLIGRIDPGAPSVACALGMVGVAVLIFSLVTAAKFLGKGMGNLFRV
ncbi:MAG: iron ABC transporter permease [Verrucomicrobia bacterium]|nr:iron ABC transporter permease [Verrucomicrobiota bacterium]MCF7708184.1 iron ABC transporter permease [Verrucomicrobiota bacterium]